MIAVIETGIATATGIGSGIGSVEVTGTVTGAGKKTRKGTATVIVTDLTRTGPAHAPCRAVGGNVVAQRLSKCYPSSSP